MAQENAQASEEIFIKKSVLIDILKTNEAAFKAQSSVLGQLLGTVISGQLDHKQPSNDHDVDSSEIVEGNSNGDSD